MATWKIALAAGLAMALVSTSAFAPDFSVLLGGSTDLQQRVEAEAAKSARAAQAFGNSLSAAERRDLQGACTALVANSNDARAQSRLREYLMRYKDNNQEAVLRTCLDPAYRQLQSDLEANSQAIRRASSRSSDEQALVDLESKLQQQNRSYTAISNIMKTKHDTARNAINNVR
jgi:hypothetical protein